MARGRTVRDVSLRGCPSLRRGAAFAALVVFGAAFAAPCAAASDPIKATIEAKASDGYARLVFSMSGYDDATARVANSVLIISFKHPIDVSVERLAAQLPDYIGAARRDPDGQGIR